jgi:predicted RecA/RadA family phage recombinase
MKNFVQSGRMLTLTAPSGGVSSGAGVLSGSIFGVAAFDAAEGAEVEVATEGVFELPKTTGTAWTVGLPIFWNDTTKKAATTGDLQIGVAVAAVGSSAAVGLVKLGPKPAVPAAAIADLAANADLPTAVAKINTILAELRTAKVIAAS